MSEASFPVVAPETKNEIKFIASSVGDSFSPSSTNVNLRPTICNF